MGEISLNVVTSCGVMFLPMPGLCLALEDYCGEIKLS